MANVNLQPNEGIIMQHENVSRGGFSQFSGDLVLTTKNIIYVHKGIFGNVKGEDRFPLNQLQKVDGKPQVTMGRSRGGYPQLDLFFVNGQQSFCFQSLGKREVKRWIDAINRVVSGESTDDLQSISSAIPGAAAVAETVKDTFDTFRNVIGKKSTVIGSDEKVTSRCISCRAPITGTKGQLVKCLYCDTKQTL